MHANLHINVIARSGGRSAVGASAYRSGSAVTARSAVACAAYRAGEKMADQRYEKTHDFTKKENVLASGIIAPDGAPAWMTNREKLWNAVEAGERRKDARLAKEAVLVLPRHLDTDQHKQVVETFIRHNLTPHGLVADYAIHSPEASDGDRNPHAHVLFTLRPVEGEGFGKKLTGFKNVLDNPDTIPQWRQSYEGILNRVSEQGESEIRFDLRSLKEKGINREPMPKIGPKVTHLEKRGYHTEWGKEVRQTQARNAAKQAQQAHNSYIRATYLAGKAVDAVRDDIAHKYYEVMYGAEAAYGDLNPEHERERDSHGYER